MKQFPPIVLFFILLFCRCSEHEKQHPMDNDINDFINKSRSEPRAEDRLLFSDKAHALSKKSKKDSLAYKALYNKIETDISLQQDSTAYFLDQLRRNHKKEYQQAGYFYLKGNYFKSKNADSSFSNYYKSKQLYLSLQYYNQAAYDLILMSELQRIAADYTGAEESITEASNYFENPTYEYQIHIYNTHGLIYKALYDYDKAISYYKKALDLTAPKDSIAKNVIKNNIALIYMDQDNYSASISILDSLHSSPSLNSDPVMKAKVSSNLGYSIYLSKKGNGLAYLKQAEAIQDTIDDDFGRLSNYLNLSDAYRAKSRTVSKDYASKAYRLAKKIHNSDDRLKALELLLKATEGKSDSDKIFSEYIALNDSIKKTRQMARNGFAKIKYDSTKAEKDAFESKLLAEKTRGRNQLLLFAILFLIIVGILIYRSMKKKSIREKLKVSYATETRISRKVHDELANDIYNAMQFTGTQDLSLEEKKERLLEDLDSVYKRTRDISKENASIETGENFPLQLLGMLLEYQNEKVNIVRSGIKEIAWENIDAVKKITVYRVLQELMVNMAKHSQATVCLVNFKNTGKNIEVFYSDNGGGMDDHKIVFKNGLANAETRIKAIGGSLTFDPILEKGIKIAIIFPA